MKPTADYFKSARAAIEKVCRDYRPTLLKHYGKAEYQQKDDRSLVTKLDLELEDLLKKKLKEVDNGVGFVGEEHGKEGSEKTFWLIDPIDGTENFIRGLPFAYNMATLIDNNKPVFAFVYRFVSDELFIATAGQGTYKNGRPVQVSQTAIKDSWLEIDTTYFSNPESMKLIKALESKIKRLRKIDDFTYVIEGKVDGDIVYRTGGHEWDYAPRALMVAEAGGRVANIGKPDYDYRDLSLIATNPLIFDELHAAIKQGLNL